MATLQKALQARAMVGLIVRAWIEKAFKLRSKASVVSCLVWGRGGKGWNIACGLVIWRLNLGSPEKQGFNLFLKKPVKKQASKFSQVGRSDYDPVRLWLPGGADVKKLGFLVWFFLQILFWLHLQLASTPG